MRSSTHIAGPVTVITLFYAVVIGGSFALDAYVPSARPYLPFGGIDRLLEIGADTFEPVQTMSPLIASSPRDIVRLMLGILSATLLMAPITWVYFITTRRKDVNRSLAQTVMMLPIIVAGIAMIVQNSIPLAFSLAGIVAAVRFRFTLTQPAHALYIFAAITIGLGAGISAVGVSAVVSVTFVYASLLLWWLNYGANLNTPFFAFLTGRGVDDDEL